jgi:hypothetical protein
VRINEGGLLVVVDLDGGGVEVVEHGRDLGVVRVVRIRTILLIYLTIHEQ